MEQKFPLCPPGSLEGSRAGASLAALTTGIHPLGGKQLLALVGVSQFADWEVLVPEVSAFRPL